MASVVTNAQTTIGVNAAFLQEVKDSNLPLWSTLHELRELPSSSLEPIEASRILVTKLGDLREHMALEFTLEETYGYIHTPSSRQTVCGHADASAARMQHGELYLEVHDLCEQAEEAQYRGTISRDLAAFVKAFREFDENFRAHEELEAELIRYGLGLYRS